LRHSGDRLERLVHDTLHNRQVFDVRPWRRLLCIDV
jgi:hypothetical protein